MCQASAAAEEDEEAPAPRPSGTDRMPIQQSSAGALGQFSWRNPPPGVASPATGSARFCWGCVHDGLLSHVNVRKMDPCAVHSKSLVPHRIAMWQHVNSHPGHKCPDEGRAQTSGLTVPSPWCVGTIRAAHDMGTVVSPAKVQHDHTPRSVRSGMLTCICGCCMGTKLPSDRGHRNLIRA